MSGSRHILVQHKRDAFTDFQCEAFLKFYVALHGYGSSWRKARKKFLDEHPFCELCRRQGRTTQATLVHHIKAARQGGTDDEENLMALCASCHSSLHG
ncbi:MAG: HNH endonuclease, partial [Spirochaetia bacterium]|nr:HNH endonuclease [Spirochaetia bacterium]